MTRLSSKTLKSKQEGKAGGSCCDQHRPQWDQGSTFKADIAFCLTSVRLVRTTGTEIACTDTSKAKQNNTKQQDKPANLIREQDGLPNASLLCTVPIDGLKQQTKSKTDTKA